MELDFRPFDADNHYYEPLDAFTRYQDQAMRRRGVQVLRRNVWVTPYYEEDLGALAETIGVQPILFGSDWLHGEGLAEPLTFSKELTGFSPDEVRMIMRDNVIDLLGGVAASE